MVASTDSISTDAKELVDLVVGYAKQETLDPVKKLGKTVALGVVGAILTGVGFIFLTLASLRALQSETDDTFDDELTFVPYAIVMVVLLIGAVLAWKGLGPGREREDSR